ncbi:hypothetical protein D1164_12395 [Mariniphaga sediminis]|uniref:Uncharacterized protein n=1 Tax=Mariniphaga sediminis TaxID=1628158 RepID=A0A399CZS4_9BACT|nr:hypothetical protein [Mariniphaga sediminis]RIH64837.1 hypothetical protein D1164_12395 [Mariniphaga sediminis]
MKIKKALSGLIFFLVASGMTAQNGISVYEGARFRYRVDFHEGNQYTWQVFNQLGPPASASAGEFSFTGAAGLNETEIQWDLAGTYYLSVTETDLQGCSNTKALTIQVLPNHRSIGFDITASNECFTPAGFGFELALTLLANHGEPLPKKYYPVNVTFAVNGATYEQVIEPDATTLQITETMFAANPAQDTQVLIEITGATDRHSAGIFPDDESSTHTRTIFAIPEIEFTQQIQLLKRLNEKTTAHTMFIPVCMERQEPR